MSDTHFKFIQVKSDNSGNLYLTKRHYLRRLHGVTKRLYAMETLDDLLLKLIDDTMKQVFKETGTRVIYGYLENNSHLKREEIVEKPEVFSAALERLLSSGALVLEKLILKNLYHRLGLTFKEKKDYAFSRYVDEVRKKFEG